MGKRQSRSVGDVKRTKGRPVLSSPTIAAPGGSTFGAAEHLTFPDLDEVVQVAARWIAESYIAKGNWPNQIEFARFCFGADICLDHFRAGNWHDVFDGSIGSVPRESDLARVKPWIFYDLGLAPDAFRIGFECFIGAVHRLAEGPETTTTIESEALSPSVSPPIRRLVGQLLREGHSGSVPDSEGRWSVIVDMHDVNRPLPDLAKFIKRPERRRGASAGAAFAFGRAGQKPTLWAFVSSTLHDLIGHRQAALEAALRLKVLPLGMELWTASPQPPLRDCLDELSEADLMILIVGCRYGSQTEDGRSYTEAEYEHAKTLGIPTYVFLPSFDHLWPERMVERKHARKLEKLVERLRKETTVAEYRSVDDLRSKVIHALSKAKAGVGDRAVLNSL